MKFPDAAYGQVEVTDPVLLEVIMSAPVQRLKGLNQYGSWQFILPKLRASRFDHSLGVCFLLKRLEASQEEQVAGLLHDISHTAFSHVVDYLYRQEDKQEHHETLFQQMFMNSQIPKIAQANGMKPEIFLEMQNFQLLERAIPDLCADRLDYFFRDSVLLGVCKPDDIKLFMEHLIVRQGEILVDNVAIAKNMAIAFIECSKKLYASPTQAASFQILADAIKSGLEAGIITEGDFLLTDRQLYSKLKSSRNMSVISKLELLNPYFFAVNSPQDFDFFVKTKARYVDPKVVQGGKASRLSELDSDYRKQMLDFIERVSGGYYVKVFPRIRAIGSPDGTGTPAGSRPEKAGLFGSLPRIGS